MGRSFKSSDGLIPVRSNKELKLSLCQRMEAPERLPTKKIVYTMHAVATLRRFDGLTKEQMELGGKVVVG